jgi:hypothetical protein
MKREKRRQTKTSIPTDRVKMTVHAQNQSSNVYWVRLKTVG